MQCTWNYLLICPKGGGYDKSQPQLMYVSIFICNSANGDYSKWHTQSFNWIYYKPILFANDVNHWQRDSVYIQKIRRQNSKSGSHPQMCNKTISKLERTQLSLKTKFQMALWYQLQWHEYLSLAVLRKNTSWNSNIGCKPRSFKVVSHATLLRMNSETMRTIKKYRLQIVLRNCKKLRFCSTNKAKGYAISSQVQGLIKLKIWCSKIFDFFR